MHMKGCDADSDNGDRGGRGRLEVEEEAAREDGVRERHWGEILERSFSNHSLENAFRQAPVEEKYSNGSKTGNGSVISFKRK